MRRYGGRNERDDGSCHNRRHGHDRDSESQPNDRAWPFDGRFEYPKEDVEAARQIDPDKGVLSMVVYWRPKANADEFDAGEKVHMSVFLPHKASDLCPCGSTKRFVDCCSHKPRWNMLVPNPALKGYDVMRPASVTYVISDMELVVERLQTDPRFKMVDRESPHWLFLDSPPRISKYGMVNFGDVDIKEAGRLRLETMSARRMQYLREIVEDMCGSALSLPYCEEGELVTASKPGRR